MFLILPHAERMYDKCRQLTSLEHHIEEYNKSIREIGESHWQEIEKGYASIKNELTRDPTWGQKEWNFNMFAKEGHLHYHVWIQDTMIDILKYLKLKILLVVDDVPERHDRFFNHC